MTEEKENIVKKVCKELNITQAELGRQLDIPASTINTWASGKIPKMAEVALTLMLENKQQKEILEAIKKARDFIGRI
ncbi:helix-turn-helix domain-containing protein [Campylobacter jejuni]|nr:helix-turn-helix transcriptional regulator [Campylobacter jejuni]HED8255606.1 helix-turn-helix transcriptional regulator [Campylobacter jejuni]HED8257689.1 helix-turn-helix transcriptional regulator [Campylobacter jejuni]HED8268385.1 helix-turn-helix transcriptional regulator [Campylobacter jejuni]HED8275747.1 helix-turn-helix transcriptional regulator [Campylobacter jejuni]